MDIKIGDKIIYTFPNSEKEPGDSITGLIEFIGETFVSMRSEENVQIKISYKNFHLIKPFLV